MALIIQRQQIISILEDKCVLLARGMITDGLVLGWYHEDMHLGLLTILTFKHKAIVLTAIVPREIYMEKNLNF